ncbi:hypothetical protein DTO96_101571 [Ephemeroptericola cinctiostellae]|uniref:Kazal-like domain-containing protein n=1 Tax=Ephemeroptericola cinctiostellae TaxID=2268024 RepID=A0A345DBU3_9BURK|nr:hypothetical protein [Ephemeroptericola cinctiostellae]AXF85831.1 hypothetical protein DTO96_101571 [Ephemeroptericola cinctiostellae]
MRLFCSILCALALTACTHIPVEAPVQGTETPPATPQVACQEPRPEICTRDYRPVCAIRDTGIRCVTTPCPSTELKTYSNACSACSDATVMGFTQGTCVTH